ncbi:uncharacterized protein LOC126976803 isoform X2 [Leptidea sinapis]|uniref:uncharacterized protein LOC126976803 isoform X2 n=1 Tax=Leptidea sinapis TaxID=189913 RepID=UPI00212F2955|nr:uncharacterized protein LOC126976803 isoform X2 [Leptidea sinapis]
MDNSHCKSDSKASNETTDTNCLISKLRRLKLQEQILTSAVNQICSNTETENANFTNDTDFKIYLSKLRNAHSEIRNLFEDIHVATQNQENLKNIELDDVKRDILTFEDKLGLFKEFIRRELSILKVAAKELNVQLSENNDEIKFSKITKVQSKQFNEVVPSPVRVLIKSPFKCQEVQRLQDFMKNSPNRYGGWNEYNHNIFTQIWKKHFECIDITNELITLENFEFSNFRDEIIHKIAGIKDVDIISHARWYLEYVLLKSQQDVALSKWQENKRKIKNQNTERASDTLKNKGQLFELNKRDIQTKHAKYPTKKLHTLDSHVIFQLCRMKILCRRINRARNLEMRASIQLMEL